ncbi:MAG: SAM-dependent methyltransferase [Nocardioidaceae bacterium]|nr:SAM-dependent methyltransferase [Nocardioidaceae bacterium]
MPEPLSTGLDRVRRLLLDTDGLVRAVASGKRRGQQPPWRRIELRYVDLRAGRHLQLTTYDQTQAHTSNSPAGPDAARVVDGLLAQPFGGWHVRSTGCTTQLRVTKRGDAQLSRTRETDDSTPDRSHDRGKHRLLGSADPWLIALGIADNQGRVKPSRQAKLRQVEEFCRLLAASVDDALAAGHLRSPTEDDPLRVVDLGCGNAYLTFAAHRYLTSVRGLAVATTGLDVKEQSRARNSRLAAELGAHDLRFEAVSIADATLDRPPDVALALHACDTATDDALARALQWQSPLILAAPCCHHQLQSQLRRQPAPEPYALLTRHGILRERLADTLTDALRAALVRMRGYRVDVVEFVGSEHTPRNTLLRAVRTGSECPPETARDYAELVAAWRVTPRLAELLGGA